MKMLHFIPVDSRILLGKIRTRTVKNVVKWVDVLDPGTTFVPIPSPEVFAMDGLATLHQVPFRDDATFRAALAVGHQVAGADFGNWWRIYVAVWAATTASKLDGDFIEIGTGRGVTMATVLASLDWDGLSKKCYLVDTFSPFKVDRGTGEQNADSGVNILYADGKELVAEAFSRWKNICLVQGKAPQVLKSIDSATFSFVHIDLNSPEAEIDSLSSLWELIVNGGIVLFDDYTYMGCEDLRLRADQFAHIHGLSILGLPTGQGILIKAGF